MRKTTTFHVRIPVDLKKAVQAIAERNGLELASVIRLFFTHMVMRGTVPLPWLTINGFSPETEERLLEQIRESDIVGTLENPQDVEKFIDGL